LDGVVLPIVLRQDQYKGGPPFRPGLLEGIKEDDRVQFSIQDYQIGILRGLEHISAGIRFSDYSEIAFGPNDAFQTFPKNGLVVD